MKTSLKKRKSSGFHVRIKATSINSIKVAKQDIWFVINSKGCFKSVSPFLLDYLDGMDHQFFETVFCEKSGKSGLPSPVEYLTEMINLERDSVFVEKVLKKKTLNTLGAYWNVIAEDAILKFVLSEAPPTAEAGERWAG